MKQPLLQTLLIVLTAISLTAQTPISGGAVSGTWTAAGSPYQINGDITINSGETLTIEPGVEVIFQGYYRLEIEGSLMALGAQGDSILFSINDTTGFSDYTSENGGWNGIYSSDISIINNTTSFDYCIFNYSKNASGSGGSIRMSDYKEINITNCRFENNIVSQSGGAINVFYVTDLLIENCLLKNNYAQGSGGAVNLDDIANVTIDNCTFKNNHAGSEGAIELSDISSVTVADCQFVNNSSSSGAGALEYYVYDVQGNVQISECYFEGNIGGSAGAIRAWNYDVISNPGNLTIANSIFYNNHATVMGGGLDIEFDNIKIEYNLIANNSSENHGGGLYLYGVSGICRNNIIVNNNSGLYGGGVCSQSSAPFFYNNTIANNNAVKGGGIYRYFSDIDMYNSIIYGNTKNLSTVDNIDEYQCTVNLHNCITDDNPYFINPTAGSGDAYDALNANWDFGYGSPCHNGGDPNTTTTQAGTTDYAGNPRIYDNIIDIGAYEKQVGAGIDDKVSDKYNINIYPNPTSDFLNIELENPQNEKLKVEIIDILGKIVHSSILDSENTQIDVSSFKKGVYFVKIKSEQIISVNEIIIQ